MELKKNKNLFANRLNGVSESATLQLNSTVQWMKSQGIDVINLTAGEPDFWAPDAAKEAIIEALKANRSKYTPVAGIQELREKVAEKTNFQQPLVVEKKGKWLSKNVLVTNGGKQALFNTLMCLLNPGDEVLIPSPYWLSYPEMVKLSGGIPKFISAPFYQNFKIHPKQLKEALGPRVKILILNSPNNPTGSMYSKEEFQELAEVLLSTSAGEHVWVISDEIYDRIVLGETPFCSFLNAAPELRDRTVTINGMSKSAAMTGWRIGWSVANEDLTSAMITLQGQSTSGINSLAQWGSLAALKLPEEYFKGQIASFKNRRDRIINILSKNKKLDILIPEGAFYTFVGVKHYLRPAEDSISFAQRLLEEAKVAVVPGAPFGEPEFIRFSFATDETTLEEGFQRFISYLN